MDVTQSASYRIGLGDPARVGAGRYRDRVTYRSVSDDGLQRVSLSHLDAVQLSVRGQAALVGADVTDPGTLDWSAMATLSVWPDEEEPGQTWHSDPGVALSVTDVGDGSRELIVLAASGLLVDLERVGNVIDALDARSGDYEHFVPLFGRHRSFGVLELDGELEEKLEPGGIQVVIVDRVRLASAWRGLGGVGRLLTGRLLRWVCAEPRVVAVHPFPIDLDEGARQDPAVFEPALARVRRMWASVGFERFTDDIWIMDPHLLTHSKALARIARRLGL